MFVPRLRAGGYLSTATPMLLAICASGTAREAVSTPLIPPSTWQQPPSARQVKVTVESDL